MDKQDTFQRAFTKVGDTVTSSCSTFNGYYDDVERAVSPACEYLYLVLGTISIMVVLSLLKRW